ncbi:MAG: penicillin-binding protein 2 [Pseudomonadales bacterium]|nr:penicillin-binding protein 2 [Pseudomonadales bacterium]
MGKPVTLKDHYNEARIYTNRTWLALFVVFVLIFTLIGRIGYLQIFEYDTHITKSDQNRINVQAIPPTRGLIYDRSGILLADNRPNYSVSIIKERVDDIDQTIDEVSAILTLTTSDIERFKKRLKRRRRPYEGIPLRFNLSEEEIARVAVNQHQLPGVEIEADLVRHYPLKHIAAHTIGYVARINQKDEQRIDANRYAGTHHIGKIGIERYYEDHLHGEVGVQKVETNARGRILSVLERTDPTPGQDLHLYMDIPTQIAATASLTNRRGAIVAIDPTTGGILAFVSTPAYNPNLFVTGIDHKSYNALNQSLDRPLFNRTIQGQYPPGSTIKPFVGLAGLDYEVTSWDFSILDPGFYRLDNDRHQYRDWKKWGHGKVNLVTAIRQSCDTFFYDMSYKLGIDNLHDFMAPFGFGRKTDIDIGNEQTGLLPSKAWKRRRYDLPWFPGETLIAGIGQGFMLATPLQLAVATANLANRGHLIKPKLASTQSRTKEEHRSVDTPKLEKDNLQNNELKTGTENQVSDDMSDNVIAHESKSILGQTDSGEKRTLENVTLSEEENWQLMFDAMESVVHHPKGTARKIGIDSKYRIAGKTGTAQVLGIKQDEAYDAEKIDERYRDHALFIGFAPADNPQIAVAVIVENGGGGGSTAAPIARIVMDSYLHNTWQKEHTQKEIKEDAVASVKNQ